MESAKTEQNITKGQEEAFKGMTAGDGVEEEQMKRGEEKWFSEAATSETYQDSGLCPSQGPIHMPTKLTAKPKGSQGMPPYSPCMTSTPKKKLLDLAGESDYKIISSHMILEDPMLSSIDEPGCLTDHQAESLSDEETEELSSRFHTTQIRARVDASQKEPFVYKRMNDVSESRISRSQSLSDAIQQQCGIDASASASVKKNLFDIPISPKLKNRVRERLYTLVNSIDGYENRVYLRDEELSSHSCNIESLSKINVNSPKGTKMDMKNLPQLSGQNALGVSSHQNKTFHDHCNLSALSSSIIGHYECALSSILGSQMRSLQYHQEQFNQEKLSVAVQKKEQEANARISIYHEKLKLMTEMVEELELNLSKHQATAREDAEHCEQRLREQEEHHRQELVALRAECHKKIEEAEAQTRSAQAAAAKNCEQRISEVLAATRVRAVMIEKENEAHISELTSTISKLRAEKKVLEASLEDSIFKPDRAGLVASTPLLQAGREATQVEASQRKHTDRSKTGSRLYEDLHSIDLLKKKFQEEVEFWKRETERLQKMLHEAEMIQRKFINDTFQDMHSKSMTDLELLRMQNGSESEALGVPVTTVQEKLSQVVKENIALKQKLMDSQKKEADLSKKLSLKENEVDSLNAQLRLPEMQALQENKNLQAQLRECEEQLAASEEQQKQAVLSSQLDMEKKTSAAVSASLTHHQEKTRLLLADLRKHYEELIRRIQAHSRAQITEYKKAVRYLKQRIKILEKG